MRVHDTTGGTLRHAAARHIRAVASGAKHKAKHRKARKHHQHWTQTGASHRVDIYRR